MARQKLVENFSVQTSSIKKIALQESEDKPVLVEGTDGQSYKCVAAYTFPISRPDEKNLNERVYTSKLWEKVIKEKQAEGSFGLMDHPNDDGSVKDAWVVWRNLRFSEDVISKKKLVVCDAYLFGTWGRQVNEAIEAGGQVGLSSVGYGDFKKDGFTIEESSYELDRVADHVLNPSYQVFGSDESPRLTTESTLEEKDTINTTEGVTAPEKSREKVPMSDTKNAASIEEKNFKLSIRNFLKEAQETPDLKEKISSYREILSYFEDVDFAEDMKSEIESSLTEALTEYDTLAEKGTKFEETANSAKEASEKVEEAQVKLETFERDNAELSEKLASAYDLLDSFKTYTGKLKELHELSEAKANGMVSAKEYKELLVYTEAKEEELEEAQKEVVDLNRKIKKLVKNLEEGKEDLPLDGKFKEVLSREDLKENYPVRKLKRAEKKASEEEEEDDEDEEEKEESTEVDPVDTLIAEAVPAVAAFYQKMENAYPDLYKIAEDILIQRTVMEAQQKFFSLKSLVEETDTRYERRSILNEDESKGKEKPESIRPLPKRNGWL